MWKAPNRPRHEISQGYNDGFVKIYRETDAANPGYAPQVELTFKVGLPYHERVVGIRRYYDARQNQTRVERVIRVQDTGLVSNLDTAILEDGSRYRIDLVQHVEDVWPPSADLTLVSYQQGAAK